MPHSPVEMAALSVLLPGGLSLVAESFDQHVSKRYICDARPCDNFSGSAAKRFHCGFMDGNRNESPAECPLARTAET